MYISSNEFSRHHFLRKSLKIVCSSDNCFLFSFPGGFLQLEPTQRWSIEQIRSCVWLSTQTFLPEHEPFPLNLTYYWSSVDKDIKKSNSTPGPFRSSYSFEDEAHSKLEDLGITSELLQSIRKTNQTFSTRDSINGTYRIILHHLQKQSNPIERDDLSEKIINEDLSASWGRSMSFYGEPGERTNSFGKIISVSYGGPDAKTKRKIDQARKTRPGNIQSNQQTKVCTIL